MTNQQVSALQRKDILPCDLDEHRYGASERHFAVVGHRGVMALAPENSAYSFALAETMGVDEIELDVRLTADGIPIVLHDPTLERLAAAAGVSVRTPVDRLSLAQCLDVPLDSGQPVMKFTEVLELTNMPLQVEIKDPAAVVSLADILLGSAHLGRIKFSSFLPKALHLLALHLPAIPRGLIVDTFPANTVKQEELDYLLDLSGATTLYTGFDNLTPVHVTRLHMAGIEVHVWPLRCQRDLDQALELNADGGTADDPGQARQWLHTTRTRAAAAAVVGAPAHG
ncbi:glycerophosphodiester phosphodiesterase [Pseudarthrobacter sp. R1]|uniref:glycerophosphodiester phosphodiesterase n=1 Tax=Pseudarthrobacter sp. R1 TaxID=2944934 RepID=UPI00210E7406|nr:glycerophosphodiester phosphodiesterase [Pseudarthrobacter sp. R1]MCQ6272907.1 glycerophosphodiester phosphodiesterase [Pseudarthrobacter sp. R1]